LPATIAPMRDIVRHCWGLLGALLAATSVSPTCAASDQELYKGRTVQVIVGFSAGGGYDLYARVLARHLGKHLPGSPSSCRRTCPARIGQGRELHLQCRAQGRHSHRHVRPRAANGAPDRPHRGAEFRRDQVHLDRQCYR
jgi:hypothetical protein